MPDHDPMDTDEEDKKQGDGAEDNEDGDSEDEEKYPPWLDHIVNGEYYNGVTVVADEEDKDTSQKNYIRCKEIIVPDPADAARGLDPTAMRRWKLKKFSTVLIVSTPADPPYVGLIDKIWRDAEAQPNPSTKQYETSDFHLECYWFYRPGELPPNCWQGLHRQELRGSRYQLPGERKVREERQSQRQLLFSSHHTRHDYPAQNGLLSLEGFLQKCKVHWLDLDGDPPERYFIHKGSLVRCREPGFVVQGFLWCNNKLQLQLHTQDKRAYRLKDDWGDKATMKIVQRMKSHYDREACKLQERNQRIREKYARLYQQKANGEISDIPSDDGEEPGKEQQQQQSSGGYPPGAGRPASPVLPGVASPAANPPADRAALSPGVPRHTQKDTAVLDRPNDPFGDDDDDDD